MGRQFGDYHSGPVQDGPDGSESELSETRLPSKLRVMGTTSGELGSVALEALSDAGVRYALLHGRKNLDTGSVSDIDIVVGEHPLSIVRQARSHWVRHDLVPIVVCPYDVGGTAAVFLATRDAQEGVQLDMLFDPEGIGMYGLRSGRLLDTVTVSSRIPEVDEVARLVYLWRKGTVKKQSGRLTSIAQEASLYSPRELEGMVVHLSGVEAGVDRVFDVGAPQVGRRSRWSFRHGPRLVERVLNPVGFWAHFRDHDVASELARRADRYLVLTRSAPVPSLAAQLVWYPWVVVPVRLRPGAMFTWGPNSRFLFQPDLIVDEVDPDDAAALVIRAMSKRAARCES